MRSWALSACLLLSTLVASNPAAGWELVPIALPTRIQAQPASCTGRNMKSGGPCIETVKPAPEEPAGTAINRAGRQEPKVGTKLQ